MGTFYPTNGLKSTGFKAGELSGIINDPNDWGKEIGNPRYILDLPVSVVNVSVKTVDIVESPPSLSFSNWVNTTIFIALITKLLID